MPLNIPTSRKDTSNKYLTEKLTKTYKKASKNGVNRINSEAKKIAKKLKLDDKIQKLQETETFIFMEDHEEVFLNSPSIIMFDPSK